jgi:glycosyltransferase involved in cell wall biosynthesis
MRLAIVVPRYGDGILGGAETFARELAEHLPRSTFDVEVLTTCADDLATWRNVYPPGLGEVNDIPVRRFPIDHKFRDEERYWELMVKFTNRWPTTVDEEYEWIHNNAHSPELYAHLDRYGLRYDLLIFIPYVFGTTFYGVTLHPDRSVIWPCLHDEPFARFLHTRLMMSSCRGLMFNSEPEMALARGKLAIRHPGMCVVGAGIEDYEADPDRFRHKFNVTDPFILYAGRLSSMKNLLELFSFFLRYRRERAERSLKLVLLGKGPLAPPSHPDIVPLGFLPEQDKLDAYAAATVLCQPSLMESFSIVVMEAWLSGVPVLVHGDCDVTRYHVLRSNGGLYYAGFEEFTGALDWLMTRPDERARMGQLGRAYVLREYNWATVLERFDRALALWQRL